MLAGTLRLQSSCHRLHFTDEKMEAQGASWALEIDVWPGVAPLSLRRVGPQGTTSEVFLCPLVCLVRSATRESVELHMERTFIFSLSPEGDRG